MSESACADSRTGKRVTLYLAGFDDLQRKADQPKRLADESPLE